MTLGPGNEPFVVVDRFEPNNVAVGANFGAWISTNSGGSFISTPLPAGYGGDPGLGIDSGGRIYFSYLVTDAGGFEPDDLDIAVSNTNFVAQNFSPPLVVSSPDTVFNTGGDDDKELLAADYFTSSPFRNNVYVAWRETNFENLTFSRSTDNGTTFSAPAAIRNAGAFGFGGLSGADPEVGPSGELYIAYWVGNDVANNQTGEIRIAKSTDGGLTFPVDVRVSAAAGTVGFDASLRDHDAGLDRTQLPNQDFRAPVLTMLDVEADPLRAGNVYAVWTTDPDGTTAGDGANVMFSRSLDGGLFWSTPIVLNDDGGSLSQFMPSVAVDEAGNVTVIWYDERQSSDVNNPTLAVFATVSLDGGNTFSTNFQLPDSAFTAPTGTGAFIGDYIKVAAVDGFGYATWTQTIGGTNQIRFHKFPLMAAFPDTLEPNNTLANATVLGSMPQITLNDLTIHDEDDVDFFKVTAHSTGKLLVNAYFQHNLGDIDIRLLDSNGNIIASSLSVSDNEQLIVPVVSQAVYFVQVSGVGVATNLYDLEIENFPAPIPSAVLLHPSDDKGLSFIDAVTDASNPRIVIQADLTDFAAMGITILDAATANAGLTPGAAVEVFVNGLSKGFANPRANTNSTVYDFTLSDVDLPAGTPVEGGFLNLVSAAVRIFDGQRTADGTQPSPASGRTQLSEPLRLIWADTAGPQVTGLGITDSPAFNLFLGKADDVPNPTPPITSLSVNISDLPNRTVPPTVGSSAAVKSITPSMIRLVGDHSGVIAVKQAVFIPNVQSPGLPATGTIRIDFFERLPDDRYTLTLFDAITDSAGNRLDGESNAQQPSGAPTFPSGDGVAGGDFVARFTVDSLPEIGVASSGSVQVDTNGNWFWDPTNADQTNRDLTYVLGNISDYIFAGNFVAAASGTADGFDKLAAYGRIGGLWRWRIDTDNNGVPNLDIVDPAAINGFPFAGNFDGNKTNGDEVGAFDGVNFWLDTNHDFLVDTKIASDLRGHPIAGDFDGDGSDDLGTYRNDRGDFEFDLSGAPGGLNGTVDAVISFKFPGVMQRPVAADMDGDGIDDIGLRVSHNNFAGASGIGEWYFLVSRDPIRTVTAPKRTPGTVVTLAHPFSPAPLGNDLFASFGDELGIPLVGNFDPPVSSATPSSISANQAGALVGALYRDILGRTVDADGLAYYTNQLVQGATTQQVARWLMNSRERFGRVVDGIYATFLHRTADAAGRDFWIDALADGATEEEVAVGFLESAEYAAKNAGDGAFVAGLYRDILGRSPDASGRSAWTSALAAGASRAAIAQGFFQSRERLERVVDLVYHQVFHRNADAIGLALYADQLATEAKSVRELVAELAASDEYFARTFGRP